MEDFRFRLASMVCNNDQRRPDLLLIFLPVIVIVIDSTYDYRVKRFTHVELRLSIIQYVEFRVRRNSVRHTVGKPLNLKIKY